MSAQPPPPSTEAGPTSERIGPFAAFQNQGYLLFWTCSVVASMGMHTQTVIAQWQVYSLTGSAFQLGLVGLMHVLPVLLLGLFGGAIADVMDRRKLVAVSQACRVVIVAVLGVLTFTETIQVWHVYVGGLLGSLASAFDQPARQAMIFSLVPRQHLLNAVTWHNVQRDASNFAGPAIAGLLMGSVGIWPAYFVNGVMFAPLILNVIRLPVATPTQARTGAWTLLRDAFGFLRRSPVIITSLGLDFSLTFFGAYRALLALYAADVLDVGPQGFGFLASSVAVGGMLGSAFVLSLGHSKHQGRLQLGAMLVYAAAVAAFAHSTSFPLSVAIAGLLGCCDTVAGTMRRSIVQMQTPEGLQGRVGAMHLIIGQGGPSLGAVQAGALAGALGAPFALTLGAVACGTVALVTAARSRAFRSA